MKLVLVALGIARISMSRQQTHVSGIVIVFV